MLTGADRANANDLETARQLTASNVMEGDFNASPPFEVRPAFVEHLDHAKPPS
jgi:hypothetical protein